MYTTSSDPNLDGLSCLKKYVHLQNKFQLWSLFSVPQTQSCQQVRREMVWKSATRRKQIEFYDERDLQSCWFIKTVYKSFVKRYSNHTVVGCTDSIRHIMKISGHRNEESIKHYNTRPSAAQPRRCSDVLSEACTSTTTGTSDSNQATNQQCNNIIHLLFQLSLLRRQLLGVWGSCVIQMPFR